MAARTLGAASPSRLRLTKPLLAAAVCLLGWFAALAFAPEAALRGWLAGFLFAAGVPLGGLVLSAMMRLVPGLWDDELQRFSDAVVALVPAAALAFLPVLIGAAWLYPWDGSAGRGAFRETWMTLPFWSVRAVLFLLLAVAFSLLLRPRKGTAPLIPAAGLIVFVLLFMLASVDWFLFLDPEAHFSGFALFLLSTFFLGALCTANLLAIISKTQIDRPEILGSLLLASLLAWAYLAFMQYFISWSDNLPFAVRWYADRGKGGWGLVEYAFAALRLGPTGLLLFTLIRRSLRWLAVLSAAALGGNLLEALWLVAPAAGGIGGKSLPAALIGVAAAGALALAGVALLADLVGPRESRP